jgi:hypothetical protein
MRKCKIAKIAPKTILDLATTRESWSWCLFWIVDDVCGGGGVRKKIEIAVSSSHWPEYCTFSFLLARTICFHTKRPSFKIFILVYFSNVARRDVQTRVSRADGRHPSFVWGAGVGSLAAIVSQSKEEKENPRVNTPKITTTSYSSTTSKRSSRTSSR